MGWPGTLVGLRVVAINHVVRMVFNILGTGTTTPMCTGVAALCLRGKQWSVAHRFSGSVHTSLSWPLKRQGHSRLFFGTAVRSHVSAAATFPLHRDALSKAKACGQFHR